MRFRGAIHLTLVALLATNGFADPAAVALTWQDCVRLAAQNNPDLLASLQAVEASRADYKGSYNGILPTLTLSNSYTQSSVSTVNSGTGVISNTKQWSAQGTAHLDLIDVSQWANIQSSLASYHLSQANYRTSSSNTLLSLYQAFAGLLYAQEAVGVNKTIRDTWKQNSQMVQLRYQSGRESKGNALNTDAQLLQSEAALDQSGRDLHVSQQQLSQAVGKDSFSAFVVTGTWTTADVPRPRPEFDTLVAQNPRILAQQATVDVAQAAIRNAQSALFPTLSLNYVKGARGQTEFPQDPFWTFSGTVNYPLFGGGPTATYYATTAAQRNYDRARLDLRSVRSQVRTDLENAWVSFAQAQDQVHVQRAFLDAARQRKDESDVRYQNGLMSFDDWIRVVSDYANFQTTYLRAQQNLILAEAQWRFAQGEQL